ARRPRPADHGLRAPGFSVLLSPPGPDVGPPPGPDVVPPPGPRGTPAPGPSATPAPGAGIVPARAAPRPPAAGGGAGPAALGRNAAVGSRPALGALRVLVHVLLARQFHQRIHDLVGDRPQDQEVRLQARVAGEIEWLAIPDTGPDPQPRPEPAGRHELERPHHGHGDHRCAGLEGEPGH